MDKVDVGMITLDIDEEELMAIQPICEQLNLPLPTMVTDVYKNRGGRYNGIKIFRIFDKGTCRMTDLFMTTQYHEYISPMAMFKENVEYIPPSEWEGGLLNESTTN